MTKLFDVEYYVVAPSPIAAEFEIPMLKNQFDPSSIYNSSYSMLSKITIAVALIAVSAQASGEVRR